MKKNTSLFIASFFLLFVYTTDIWGGKIIRPWRATSEITKAGETFEVWFIAESGQDVEYVELRAAYHSLNVNFNVQEGTWEYDRNSGNTYNREITVSVPASAPEDRYDVILKTSKGNVISTGAVKVVKEFKTEYYIINTGDAHRWQHGYDGELIHRKISEIIKIGNLMDVEIFIENGDNMYSVRNHPEREISYFHGWPKKGILGMHDSNAATFMIPGNHDTHRNGVEFDDGGPDFTANFYNTYYGITYYHFTYGLSRFAMLNNCWFYKDKSHYEDEYTYQIDESVQWLNDNPGTFSFVAMHSPNNWWEEFDNKFSFTMGSFGHLHYDGMQNPHDVNGKPKKYGVITSRGNGFHFNLYKVNNNTGEVEFPSGPTGVVEVLKSGNRQDSTTWEMNYELNYANPNNGSHTDNAATIKNEFSFPFEGAHIRFLMPKGREYEIKSGEGYIYQQFHGDDFCIVDVKFDVPANSVKSIGIGDSGNIPDGYVVNHADFVSQSTMPQSMDPGEKLNVSLIMKNTGTTTWTNGAGYMLGSQNPQSNSTWGFKRVYFNESESVEPRAEKNFTFEVTAPETAGRYSFQWQMIQEEVEWFGAKSTNKDIIVGQIDDYLDDCDVQTGWTSSGNLSIENNIQKQGGACLVFKGEGIDEFKKIFVTPYKIEGSEADLTLEFWYYVSDPSKLTGTNQVELGSGGQPDINEYNWRLDGLTEGWNQIRLNFSEANKFGNPDLSSINWFRLYNRKDARITTMIDGVKITGMNTSVSIKELKRENIVSVYPNPVSEGGVSVEFGLKSLSRVSLSISDINGSIVSRPVSNQFYEPGAHRLDIPLVNIIPGAYFLQITFDGVTRAHRFIVM